MPLQVHLRRRAGRTEVDPLAVKRFARSVLRGEGVTDGALTLVLTGDAEVRDLNARFRGMDRTTDVLSFPMDDDPHRGLDHDPFGEDGERYLGDVIVSLERAREQAPRFHNDPESELARLIAHGILHVLGHDHHSPAEGKRMKAAERRALASFTPGTLWSGAGRNEA